MASSDHLHQEASVLPVRAHLSMLCSQFLLSALRPNHPSHLTVTVHSGPRNIRHTLQSRFRPSISAPTSSMASRNPTPTASPSGGCTRTLLPEPLPPFPQTGCWESARLQSLPLGGASPGHTARPSQLRSGFSSAMRDYRHGIGAEPIPECPECADPCHSVPHLFSCPARPTDLSVGDMWERPLEVARFLLSVPSFSHFPELPPPPPEPPPSPRPRRWN